MGYYEQLLEQMDPAELERLTGGEYGVLLEKYLPPPDHPRYHPYKMHALVALERGREILRHVEKYHGIEGARVLEIGCGDGGLCLAFALEGARVTGLDASHERIEKSRALARDFNVEMDIRFDTDFGDSLEAGGFDIIISNDFIEHVDDFSRLAESHHRLLADDGVLFINPPNRFAVRSLLSDPHFGLVGVSLMNKTIGEFYVTKIRKLTGNYGLNRLLHWSEVHRIYENAGFELTCLSVRRAEQRLAELDLPGPVSKTIARIVPRSVLLPLITWFVLDPWMFIGRKKTG